MGAHMLCVRAHDALWTATCLCGPGWTYVDAILCACDVGPRVKGAKFNPLLRRGLRGQLGDLLLCPLRKQSFLKQVPHLVTHSVGVAVVYLLCK